LTEATQRKYRSLERRLIRHPDLVITVNHFIAEIMATSYGIEAPQVILNATHREPRPDVDRLRALTGIPPEDKILVYQGWFSPERGIEKLVKCAAFFPKGFHLVLVGYGAFEAELRSISQHQGTDDGRVIFLGEMSNQELSEVTPFADLGTIPYHGVDLNNYYCSPNKLFEFVAAGIPFISNDLPFLRSIADQFKCGLLTDFSDPKNAAAAIIDVLSDCERLQECKLATLRAAETLNWSVEGQKLVKLYSDLG